MKAQDNMQNVEFDLYSQEDIPSCLIGFSSEKGKQDSIGKEVTLCHKNREDGFKGFQEKGFY